MATDDGGPVPRRGAQGLWRRTALLVRHPVTWVVVASFAVYATYSVSRWRQYLPAGYDLGIFDQAVRAYSEFRAPTVPLKGIDFNVLGDHFHPIIAVLAPLYWLWDDPRALLVAQAALIAVSAIPVWHFARRRWTGHIATALSVAYVLGWPLQGMADFDFHEIAFGVPLLAWAIDALDRRRDVELAVAAGLLLLVREDMGVVVLVLGLLRVLARKPRWPGWVTAAVGVVVFVLLVEVVIPAFAGTGYQYWEYPVLGSGPGDAIRTMLTHPWSVIQNFFVPGTKSVTMLVLLAPLLLLPLASPITLVALPILAERFLSDRDLLWTTEFHYNAPIWAILFFGAMDGLFRIQAHVIPARARAGTVRAVVGVLVAVPLAAMLPLAGNSAALFPLARLTTGAAWTLGGHIADQAAAVASVPPGTCVAADDRLAAHLTRTNRVTVPGVPAPTPDYVLLDRSQPEPGNPYPVEKWRDPTTQQAYSAAIAAGFRVIGTYGDVVVLRGPAAQGATAACGPAAP
ncbi:MAG TPA: DUF2079 domain-containing protein [Cellulomonas sp.]